MRCNESLYLELPPYFFVPQERTQRTSERTVDYLPLPHDDAPLARQPFLSMLRQSFQMSSAATSRCRLDRAPHGHQPHRSSSLRFCRHRSCLPPPVSTAPPAPSAPSRNPVSAARSNASGRCNRLLCLRCLPVLILARASRSVDTNPYRRRVVSGRQRSGELELFPHFKRGGGLRNPPVEAVWGRTLTVCVVAFFGVLDGLRHCVEDDASRAPLASKRLQLPLVFSSWMGCRRF